ncbi:MAG TPA: protein translocase subunit SecD [Gammaproteobacteria bacterium]
MLNRYPLWKYLLIVVILVVGALYAAPNLYGEDPAVQISSQDSLKAEGLTQRVEQLLQAADIQPLLVETADNGQVLARFSDTDIQLKAYDQLRTDLGDDYTVALNLAPATPEWLRKINALPMYLGLDLRGGVHFLLEVDMETAIKQKLESAADGMRRYLRDNNLRYASVNLGAQQITIRFNDGETRDTAFNELRNEYADFSFDTGNTEGVYLLSASFRETTLLEERKNALTQNITTLRNRVNELGVAEPVIQQQGGERIVVQLPGVQDTAKAKEILGATATLEYRLVHGTYADWLQAAQSGRVPLEARLYYDRQGQPVLLKRSVIVTGENVTGATAGFDQQNNLPAVFVTLDGKGAARMNDISGENIGQPMAVVYIENKIETREVNGKQVKDRRKVEEVISIATIRDQLGRRFQTTGLDQAEARDLALLLRAGSLRAPMEIIEERTVGPSLGKANIEKGFNSTIVGFLMVIVFMAIYYRVFGLIAGVALTANLILIVAIMSMLQATLTMPGIAGIVLSIGMAVDANVLIYERIREELRNGNSIQASMHAGYEKAFSSIADANITTLIAAIVLFGLGSGPVKGFAVTLSIGIVTSMFTAIMITRALVNLIYGGRRVTKLAI